jgi:hypothetical protein
MKPAAPFAARPLGTARRAAAQTGIGDQDVLARVRCMTGLGAATDIDTPEGPPIGLAGPGRACKTCHSEYRA